jgi:hypothetical protein
VVVRGARHSACAHHLRASCARGWLASPLRSSPLEPLGGVLSREVSAVVGFAMCEIRLILLSLRIQPAHHGLRLLNFVLTDGRVRAAGYLWKFQRISRTQGCSTTWTSHCIDRQVYHVVEQHLSRIFSLDGSLRVACFFKSVQRISCMQGHSTTLASRGREREV